SITEKIIDQIAALEPPPTKIIFRDSAFGEDISLKINSMLRLEAQMKKYTGLKKKTYRVEFI
ncbi:MAG: site-specific DNA-methyltransferase, partial [Firmicutes bacterium]|nr:site-specific DNA-methyltransferase [Bacillota bacterium]